MRLQQALFERNYSSQTYAIFSARAPQPRSFWPSMILSGLIKNHKSIRAVQLPVYFYPDSTASHSRSGSTDAVSNYIEIYYDRTDTNVQSGLVSQ